MLKLIRTLEALALSLEMFEELSCIVIVTCEEHQINFFIAFLLWVS